MKFIVEAPNNWYMRSTTWTSQKERATRFATEEEAKAGITKAAQFSKPRMVKSWKIVPE